MNALSGMRKEKNGLDSAIFSECGMYRYSLTRTFGDVNKFGVGNKTANFIMLNPSTATADEDDPTIRRCIGFAKKWDMDQLIVTNIFALRATIPKELYNAKDPEGPLNMMMIQAASRNACIGIVITAWGVHGAYRNQGEEVLKRLCRDVTRPHHLGLTKDGHPRHPLYLRGDSKPEEWR